MWREFDAFCEKQELFKKGDLLLLAMSGGLDSMVLGELMLKSGHDFQVAHANFQLRGQASEDDARFVEKWAKKNKVKFHLKRFDLDASGSIQELARKVRYHWFRELMSEQNISLLVTAHHASDNVETMFINVLRGAGAHGWSGIPMAENQIRRPLLFASKNELRAFADQESIAFREDRSNLTDHYLRNQIRHHIIPEMEKISPNFVQRVSKNQLQLRRSLQLTDALVQAMNPRVFNWEQDHLVIRPQEIKPQEFVVDVLFLELRKVNFSLEQCELAADTAESGKVFFSESHELLIDRDQWLVRPRSNKAQEIDAVEIHPDMEKIIEPMPIRIEVVDGHSFEIPTDKLVAALDFDQLKFPLVLRKWHKGDRFVPLGMNGHKLISDFLIDEKVDQFEKERTFILESDEEIVWVVGHRISHNWRITENTRRILLLTLEQ